LGEWRACEVQLRGKLRSKVQLGNEEKTKSNASSKHHPHKIARYNATGNTEHSLDRMLTIPHQEKRKKDERGAGKQSENITKKWKKPNK